MHTCLFTSYSKFSCAFLQLRAVQDQLVQAESQLAVSNSTAHTLEEELSIARSDITRYSDLAAERLQLYQRELMQHGHTMEEVEKGKQRERLLEEEAGAVRGELVEVKEELSTVKVCMCVCVCVHGRTA